MPVDKTRPPPAKLTSSIDLPTGKAKRGATCSFQALKGLVASAAGLRG